MHRVHQCLVAYPPVIILVLARVSVPTMHRVEYHAQFVVSILRARTYSRVVCILLYYPLVWILYSTLEYIMHICYHVCVSPMYRYIIREYYG